MPPYDSFPTYILIGAYVLMLALLVYALIGINWGRLHQYASLQHFFWGAILVLSLLSHMMKAGLLPALEFHLMGYTALTLLMGWRLALLVGVGVSLVGLVFGFVSLSGFAYQYLIDCAITILFSWRFLRFSQRYFPLNPFVYIMVGTFFNAGLAHVFSDLIKGMNLVLMDVYSLEQVWREYLRYLPLIMFPEGVINGMFITGMVVFNPKWLSSFDEDVYFR